eukprot:7721982-Alexandrium_andersonii.AAC.1
MKDGPIVDVQALDECRMDVHRCRVCSCKSSGNTEDAQIMGGRVRGRTKECRCKGSGIGRESCNEQ